MSRLSATPTIKNITQHLFMAWHRLILFILPLLITLINPNWIYNPPVLNNIDTWVYTGLFRYFFDFAGKHPSNSHYFIERLSWVMPGYALYHIFTPEVANALLHLGVYYLTIFALYGVMRRLFGQDSALIAALCLASYTWFLRAAGHDYVDGVGIAYYSAALWCATQAVYQIHYKGYLLGCGVFLGAVLLSQLFLAAFVPIIALYYLMLNWKNHRHSLIISMVWVGSGAIILIFGLMAFNLMTVGKFDVFANSLSFILRSGGIPGLRDIIIKDYGATPMTWMALPCLFMVCAVVCLARWKRVSSEIRFTLRLVMVMFILTLSIFIVLHFKSSYPYLILYLYMSLLIPALFLLFAGLIATISPNLDVKQGAVLLGVMLIPFVLSVLVPNLEAALLDVQLVWAIVGGAMVVLTAGLLRTRKPLWIASSFAVVSLMFSGHNGIAYYDRLYTYRIFTATSDTLALMDSQDPEPLDFSEFIILQVDDRFPIYSMPLRGMSQPIHSHAFNWSLVNPTLSSFKWSHGMTKEVLILSSNEHIMTEVNALLADDFKVKVNHVFAVPINVLNQTYLGYMLTLTRLDHYGDALFPTGDNVNPLLTFSEALIGGWTGPGSDVVLKFNLPTPKGDVVVQICGILATTELGNSLPAVVNNVPITFVRQPARQDCDWRYTADIPQSAIQSGVFTDIAMNIPVAPADVVFHNGSKTLYGMAITSIIFSTKETP